MATERSQCEAPERSEALEDPTQHLFFKKVLGNAQIIKNGVNKIKFKDVFFAFEFTTMSGALKLSFLLKIYYYFGRFIQITRK